MSGRTLGILLAILSAVVATALVANVDGFVLAPWLRFVLTLGQAGLTAAVLYCPPPSRV